MSPGVALLALALQQADSITLEAALARARTNRGSMAAAAAFVDQARGAHRIAGRIPNPMAQLETDEFAPTRKLTAVQPLNWIVRRGADRAASRAGIDRAEADAQQALADLGLDVRAAFFSSLAADELLRLSEDQATFADSVLFLAERRASAGDISNLQREQVALEAGRARLAVSQAREAAQVARIDFGRAIAWDGEDVLAPQGALDESLDDAWQADTSAAAAVTRGQRGEGVPGDLPLLRAAIADSSAAAARLRAARLAQIPVPGLYAGREWGELAGDQRNGLVIGFSMAVPLWSQGRETVAEASAAATVSAALTAETRGRTAARVAAARLRLHEAADRARFARDTLHPAARNQRSGALRLFEAGRTDILQLFDALRSERDVARDMIRELLAFQLARAELSAALGRWD